MKRNYDYVLDFYGDVFYCRQAIDNDTMNDIIDIYDEEEQYVGCIDGDIDIPNPEELNGDEDDIESYNWAVERLENAVETLLNS